MSKLELTKQPMSLEAFEQQILGCFKVDESIIALEDKLIQYYKETEHCDNRQALFFWKEFKRWACGYTSKEISQAKKSVSNRLNFKGERR